MDRPELSELCLCTALVIYSGDDMRNLQTIFIFNPDNIASTQFVSSAVRNEQFGQVEVQRIANVLPGATGNYAMGVLIWANDLQGLAADVESFASYLANENNVQGALKELGIEVNTYASN